MFSGLDWLWKALIEHYGKELGAVLIGAAIAVLGLIIEGVRRLWLYFYRIHRAVGAVSRVKTNGVLREGPGLWVKQPITKPTHYDTLLPVSRVLTVANLKGGVGKTTIAANLAACLAKRAREANPPRPPVLLIDLDFQGSLSSMTTPSNWEPSTGQDSAATYLLSGDLNAKALAQIGKAAAGEPHLRVVTAYYNLAQAENRLQLEWLLNCNRADLRFRLAELLQTSEVRNAFTAVIIDSPPRFTTGAVQAICASSHLLIPTILDTVSADAVASFVKQIEQFSALGLSPHLKYAGVVGSVVEGAANYEPIKKEIRDKLQVINAGAMLISDNCFFPKNAVFRHTTEQGITYIYMGNGQTLTPVREAIEALANHVSATMGLGL